MATLYSKSGKVDVVELTNQLNAHLSEIEMLLLKASITGTDSDEVHFGEKYDTLIGIIRSHIEAIGEERKSIW